MQEDNGKDGQRDITNLISFSNPFVYPADEADTGETREMVSIGDFIQRFAVHLITTKNPQLTLCALLYATGYDVGLILGVENTETQLAKTLGVSKQVFSFQIQKVKEEFGITYNTTGKVTSSKDNYKKNNYRKI